MAPRRPRRMRCLSVPKGPEASRIFKNAVSSISRQDRERRLTGARSGAPYGPLAVKALREAAGDLEPPTGLLEGQRDVFSIPNAAPVRPRVSWPRRRAVLSRTQQEALAGRDAVEELDSPPTKKEIAPGGQSLRPVPEEESHRLFRKKAGHSDGRVSCSDQAALFKVQGRSEAKADADGGGEAPKSPPPQKGTLVSGAESLPQPFEEGMSPKFDAKQAAPFASKSPPPHQGELVSGGASRQPFEEMTGRVIPNLDASARFESQGCASSSSDTARKTDADADGDGFEEVAALDANAAAAVEEDLLHGTPLAARQLSGTGKVDVTEVPGVVMQTAVLAAQDAAAEGQAGGAGDELPPEMVDAEQFKKNKEAAYAIMAEVEALLSSDAQAQPIALTIDHAAQMQAVVNAWSCGHNQQIVISPALPLGMAEHVLLQVSQMQAEGCVLNFQLLHSKAGQAQFLRRKIADAERDISFNQYLLTLPWLPHT